MPWDPGKIIYGAFVVVVLLIIAIMFFDAMRGPTSTLSNSSQEKVQEVENNFWGTVVLVGFLGAAGIILVFAKQYKLI